MNEKIDAQIIDIKEEAKIFIFALASVVAICLSSCGKNKERANISKIVAEWSGKEIRFPDNVPCYILGKEMLPEFCDEIFHKEFKILLYVDSVGCSDCRLKLFEWEQLIEEVDILYPGKVGFLLFFQPKSMREMILSFSQRKFNYPVFIDFYGVCNRLNQFPHMMQYQCFLLDKDNKVLVLGNPTLIPELWQFYKSQFENEQKTAPITSLKIDKTFHDYGTVRKGSINNADFIFTNTGNQPLVILRISASCGCTNVIWDKQPISPGQTTTVQIEMIPDEAGYFTKTVVAYCNANESPIRLTVKGSTIE